jgi:hypothetical protein
MSSTDVLKKPPGRTKRPVLDFDDDETHWHRCPYCRTVWAHTNDDSMDYFSRIKAHECPQCGQWTGAQIDVTVPECEAFMAKKLFKVVGTVRLTSPQNGF